LRQQLLAWLDGFVEIVDAHGDRGGPGGVGAGARTLLARAVVSASGRSSSLPGLSPAMNHVALLRAVNLAGRNMVGMADLRELAAGLGLADARTLLQSGNLVFEGDGPTARIEGALEAAAKKRLALETDFFVRSAKEWKAIIAGNPFPAEAKSDPGHLVAVVLKKAPAAGAVAALQAAIKGKEVVKAKGRELYAVYPEGIGRSKLTMALIEKKLETRGTGRNWNTVLKLAALLQLS
jgi:uncharacterized protein (DUF1697 family)